MTSIVCCSFASVATNIRLGLLTPLSGNRINWQYELRKFPRASTNTHDKVFKHLQSTSGLDPDALDYMRAHDDFIYADADPLYERFHSFLIYIRTAFVVSSFTPLSSANF